MSNGRILIDPHFSLEIWGTEYIKIKEICLLAEKLGYYGFYYGESLDCWTIISNLSAVTQMIKLGPVITYLFPHTGTSLYYQSKL